MSVRLSSKEILAKLMATENVIVEHADVPTAAFDLINRKLFLPNWKDISDIVYTLLISHEVGHALYTPKDEWESVVMENKDKDLKGVINIVEDVRIEKMIQQKFPGTVRSFKAGYDELEKQNLFGTVGTDIKEYGLLDRLNLHFKIGHFGYVNVPFTEKELTWVTRISACKTFSDVVGVSKDLLQYVKDNPESQGKSKSQSDQGEAEQNTKRVGVLTEAGSEQSDAKPEDFDEIIDPDNLLEKMKNSGQESADGEASIKTQQHFDRALQNLIDKSISKTTYANLPKIEVDKIVVPYKKVHSQIYNYYSHYYPHIYSNADAALSQFKNTSKNIVNQLANLFEMKKKARLDVRSLTTKTGVLNTNKVHSYRYSDDIFKKITTIPAGKSHGLVMFIDMSSSMSDNIVATFEQLLNLVLFCRRVNIPFEVYGFTDAYSAREGMQQQKFNRGDVCFEERFCLRQYFNNKMTGVEFNDAIKNILCLMQSYSRTTTYAGVPSQESLNCTPLNSAIISGITVVNEFRQKNNLDIVNSVFLTDGDDTHGLSYIDPSGQEVYIDVRYNRINRYYGNSKAHQEKCYLRDMKSRKQWEVKNSTEDLLHVFREMTGAKVIGFYLTSKRDAQMKIEQFVQDKTRAVKLYENFKQSKFAELSSVEGYDAYYIVPNGKNLGVKQDMFEKDFDHSVDWDNEKEAKKAMRTAQKDFANHMKDVVVSRVLLNKFIDHIS